MPVGELVVRVHGIFVPVAIGVSAPERAQRFKRGLSATLGPPQHVDLLVDTGADSTTISDQTMRSLGLSAVAQTRIHTSTTSARGEICDVYAVELVLFPNSHQPMRIGALEVIARPFLNMGADGLLGRDVLNRVVLNFDGPQARAYLSY